MRQLRGVKVIYAGEGAKGAGGAPRRERQKISTMTASLVEVSVVLLWVGCKSVGRPSRVLVGEDDEGEWIGYIGDGGWELTRGQVGLRSSNHRDKYRISPD
jgi:hypothetical protein